MYGEWISSIQTQLSPPTLVTATSKCRDTATIIGTRRERVKRRDSLKRFRDRLVGFQGCCQNWNPGKLEFWNAGQYAMVALSVVGPEMYSVFGEPGDIRARQADDPATPNTSA